MSDYLGKKGMIRWVVAGGVLSALVGGTFWERATLTAQDPKPQVSEREALGHAAALSTAFRKAAEEVLPTVVTIETRTKPKVARAPRGGRNGENPFKGTPFEEFFDENAPNGGGNFDFHSSPRAQDGTGSGVIIDPKGLILTNNHVVADADEITVRLSDGREFKSTEVKTDPQTDLAIVKIDNAGNLPAARLGNSDGLEIGDWVIAIGNPFGLDSTVSAGIISGKGRELRSGQRTRYLQTDAAINPGNSGGPLVDLEGRVIGINTAIATNNGGYQGVGFAIPVNLAKWVSDQLVSTGKVQRAWLGVQIGPLTNELAETFSVDRNAGVLVGEVRPNSPASRAGMQEGDIITRFSGKEVHSPRDLQEVVERAPLGTKQEVQVIRDGKPVALSVGVEALPDNVEVALRREAPDSADMENDFGIAVSDMDKEQAKQLGFEGYEGVLITEVAPQSIADEAGLSAGMLVLKVGKQSVKSAEEFKAALAKSSTEKGVLLLVRTEGGNRFVVLKHAAAE